VSQKKAASEMPQTTYHWETIVLTESVILDISSQKFGKSSK
jgi:hypothetical protein